MAEDELTSALRRRIAAAEDPREAAVDVMYALQAGCGWLTDEALAQGAELLGMTPLELEELATFYDFIYREPVGLYVIRACTGISCWMEGCGSVLAHLKERLAVREGETTPDGLFTVVPVGCIGDCHHAPSMIVNGRFYGRLNPARIDEVLEELRREKPPPIVCR